MGGIRVAIVGVGNCANSFVQGLFYYRGVNADHDVGGLLRTTLGGYRVEDIQVVAAFDVTEDKVGLSLDKAVWAYPNNTYRFAPVGRSLVRVQRGPTLDGRGKYLAEHCVESSEPEVDVEQVLKDQKVDVVINYLPVGSQQATEHYAWAAIHAGAAFVNCIPVFLASDPEWSQHFAKAGVPIIGDDIKSQVGATIVHRVLAQLFRDRGVKLERTMQLNVGGNGDFLNMLERERLASKKTSKTQAVTSVAGVKLSPGDVHIGPSDYVQWLSDRKWAYMTLEGTGFGGAPLELEVKLKVWDSPNSAGIVIDAVRCAKLALDRNLCGPVRAPSACYCKSPPQQWDDDRAADLLEEFISGPVKAA